MNRDDRPPSGAVTGAIICLLSLVWGAILTPRAAAQPPASHAPAAPLPVFLDCSVCDTAYVRTTIPWVDYVRDRTEAHVHLLVTTLPTAPGGTEYTVAFLGRGAFQGVDDTVQWTSPPAATPDDIRQHVTHLLALGLVRYVATAPVGQRLDVVYTPLDSGAVPAGGAQRLDPWRSWVFNVGVNGLLNGQQGQATGNVGTSLTADRTTPTGKLDLDLSTNDNLSRFTVDSSTVTGFQRTVSGSAQLLRAVGAHWSAGVRGEVSSSTFLNERYELRVAPALEYDIFPYAAATRQALTVEASLGLDHLHFVDTTIYNTVALTSGDLRTAVTWTEQQPWGSTEVVFQTSGYLPTLAREDVTLIPVCTVRLAAGLSLQVTGSFGHVQNQPYLARAGLSEADILLQQRQLATNYTYTLSVGLTYTFGSAFTNVVFPRFSSGI